MYKPVVIVSGMAYLSGHGPLRADKTLITGRLGADMDVSAGYEAARVTGLAMLATLQGALGSLDNVVRLVKLLGLVRCTKGFTDQPAVINGCSELFRDIFGEDAGVAARPLARRVYVALGGAAEGDRAARAGERPAA